jgi:hypothetical protein
VSVAGWGTLKDNGPVPDVLRAVDVHTVPHKTCRKSYFWVTEKQVPQSQHFIFFITYVWAQ